MCRVALEIVFRSDSFADATRKWARDTVWRTDESPTLTREVLQRWWQANEKSLAEKNYRAVPPGESLPLPTKMAASPGPPPANEFEPQTKTIPTELNKGTAKTTAIPRRETEGITHNQVASHWLLIAIGMVVVVIGSLIWRMRAK